MKKSTPRAPDANRIYGIQFLGWQPTAVSTDLVHSSELSI